MISIYYVMLGDFDTGIILMIEQIRIEVICFCFLP